MKKPMKQSLKQNRGKFLIIGLLGGLAVLGMLVALAVSSGSDVNAKSSDKNNQGQNGQQDLKKTLKVIAITNPTSFKGLNPYPTKPQTGQRLVAVKVDFDRDFKSQIRSSEAGEVYLTDVAGHSYFTVDTAVPQSQGPGHKPTREATFVFTVPLSLKDDLTFHYGASNAVNLKSANGPDDNNNSNN